MASEETERTEVKTYVPVYQKETWADHADRLDMSQSEFLRTMVQAGRRNFSVEPENDTSSTDTPGVEGFESRLLRTLEENGPMDWNELVESLTADVEEQLEKHLERLQSNDVVRYSGREGVYRIVEGT